MFISPQQTGAGRTGGPLYSSGASPTVPAIAFNLDAWSAVPQSSDSDPLAVDPDAAVPVSSDSDPLAVDPTSAVFVR